MILLAGAVLCVAAAAAPAPAASPDSGATWTPPGVTAPAADSAGAAALQTAVAEGTAAALPDSLVAQLDRLAARRDGLRDPDRRVFDELIAAAWQMIADGDWEAAALIAADARQWIEKPGR